MTLLFIIIGLIAPICLLIYLSKKSNQATEAMLTDLGFEKSENGSEDVNAFAMKLFKADPAELKAFYRGGHGGEWDETSWYIQIVSGGSDDPDQYLMTWRQDLPGLPNFSIARCVGVTKLGKLVRLTAKNSFRQFELNLLPELHQPFLARGKGLLLYSNQTGSLTDTLDSAQLFTHLNDPKRFISFIYYNGRVGVWTHRFRQLRDLFETGTLVKNNLSGLTQK